MPEYVLDHHQRGERERLALMSRLLDPMHRQGIDYTIGRRLPGSLAALGLERIEATAETALYNGGAPWAEYWRQTLVELRDRLVTSGELTDASIDAFLAHCADPAWWTQTIAFTAVRARTRQGAA